MSVSFDEPDLVSTAELLQSVVPSRDLGLHELADRWLRVPTNEGANAELKIASIVAGTVAGADFIDNMALLRPGAMKSSSMPSPPWVLPAFLLLWASAAARCRGFPVHGEP